ncbi:hypothetical protein VNO78_20347 [Psophocarpus tetragonolobus]|uniref:Uncharacterized protein n=1 Tax=Psophocarpus tetragonolobus TaxID=3891 RepID=A0AAN9SD79_PSOTE
MWKPVAAESEDMHIGVRESQKDGIGLGEENSEGGEAAFGSRSGFRGVRESRKDGVGLGEENSEGGVEGKSNVVRGT